MVPGERAELLDGTGSPRCGADDRVHRLQVAVRAPTARPRAAAFEALRTEAPAPPARPPGPQAALRLRRRHTGRAGGPGGLRRPSRTTSTSAWPSSPVFASTAGARTVWPSIARRAPALGPTRSSAASMPRSCWPTGATPVRRLAARAGPCVPASTRPPCTSLPGSPGTRGGLPTRRSCTGSRPVSKTRTRAWPAYFAAAPPPPRGRSAPAPGGPGSTVRGRSSQPARTLHWRPGADRGSTARPCSTRRWGFGRTTAS